MAAPVSSEALLALARPATLGLYLEQVVLPPKTDDDVSEAVLLPGCNRHAHARYGAQRRHYLSLVLIRAIRV